jgi:hypothetical protein
VPLTISLVEIIRSAIVGDKEIQVAVVIKIRPYRREPEAMFGVVYLGLPGNVGKGSVSIVVV